MTSHAANAALANLAGGIEEHSSAVAGKDHTRDLSALLSALSTMLGDTLSRFEAISSRVTQRVLTRGDAADHDLIVALQDFDRLQQEFSALGNVISHCATVSSSPGLTGRDVSLGQAVIADITLSDLKDRFLKHLQNTELGPVAFPDGDEKVF